jgi:hypothetical protein
MDLDDLFDGGRRHGKHGHDDHDHGRHGGKHREHDDYEHDRGHDERTGRPQSHGDHHDGELPSLSHLMPKLLANKTLVVLTAVALPVVIVLAVIFMLPLLGSVLGFVDQSGVKGVVDRVWQGADGGK